MAGVKPRPLKSRTIVLADGTTKSYPTLDDYVRWYVEHDLIEDEHELLQKRVTFVLASAKSIGAEKP